MMQRSHRSKPRQVRDATRGGGQPLRTAHQRRLERFAALVRNGLGIRMPDSKLSMLESRVLQRMRSLELATLAEYERYLFESEHAASELPYFIDVVTTNKTDFFREPKHFELLTREVLPALAKEHGEGWRWSCRVWCAGCSSGEEVYTLAMVLQEHAEQHAGFTFSVWGTDVSSRMLDRARGGVYAAESIEPVPPLLLRKYLLRSRDPTRRRVKVVPELRARVSFDRLNFMDSRYHTPGPFDVIFFRNVMIYFERATQQLVVTRQCRHLRRGGFMFISHTESLSGLDVPLRHLGKSVFRKVS